MSAFEITVSTLGRMPKFFWSGRRTEILIYDHRGYNLFRKKEACEPGDGKGSRRCNSNNGLAKDLTGGDARFRTICGRA